MKLHDIIKQKRNELGLTMEELAAKVGVSQTTISRWESGDIGSMKHSKIAILSRVLGISPLCFIEEDYYDNPATSRHETEFLNKYRRLDATRQKALELQLDWLLTEMEKPCL